MGAKNKIISLLDIIGHHADAQKAVPLPKHGNQFKLPRQTGPYLAFLLIAGASLFAAAQFYRPEPIITPAVAAPVVLPSPPPAQPKNTDIDQLAALMPEAVVDPLPVNPIPAPAIESRPRIKISHAVARPSVFKLTAEGIALAKKDQPAAALDAFRDAHSADPRNPAPLYNIAVLNDQMGDSAEAYRYYQATLRASPLPASISAARIKTRMAQLAAELREEARD